ncbi:MAG: tetratricopeptide repeat protein [Chloroflexota bacterium]
MFKRIQLFLGPDRLRALFLLLALTGLGNLLLNVVVDESPWARDAQTVLVIAWLAGSVWIVLGAMEPYQRGRWIGILIPAAGAVILGLLFPRFFGIAVGAALGWIVAAGLIFRPRGPEEYRRAVRHLRKNAFKEAVDEMSALIKRQPDEPAHYRFRAELFRVWGKVDRARRDYKKMTELAPDMAVAWNGLAEVELQSGSYEAAQQAAARALELAPGEWVAAYNLGMIEDRMGQAQDATGHLQQALAAKVPDARHRLLIYLYLARAHARLGDLDAAGQAVRKLKAHGGGLNEWEVILQSDQAETLRAVIAADIDTARALINNEMDVAALAD